MRLSRLEGAILLTLLREGGHNIGDSYEGYLEATVGKGTTHMELYCEVEHVCPCAYSSFSRAIRRLLYEKGLIEGCALAWVYVSKEWPEGDAIAQWQGRGREKSGETAKHAKLRVLDLSDEGYNVALRLREAESGPVMKQDGL